ncbi:TetR/AcrR family transcriptional regulator [Kocuria sp. CPCC 205300]|uniref:TetR/AcrR family transcriptional regulator n=1 Tax=Kocuria sabuli TaxID=3071448 RepID=UPI0036DD5B53
MTMTIPKEEAVLDGSVKTHRRAPLSRDRVLRAAVVFADTSGIEALSMRSLAQQLGVVPMALYKHVASKEELLDGMVDVVVAAIDPPRLEAEWRIAVRERILSARQSLARHRWACQVIQSRTQASPVVLEYMDSLMGIFLAGGVSADLTHHAMHALGTRMWGFTQDVFPTPEPSADPVARAVMFEQFADQYPHIIAIATAASQQKGPSAGEGCDEQVEFEFALDVLLEGIERLHQQGWSSTGS